MLKVESGIDAKCGSNLDNTDVAFGIDVEL